MAVVGTLNGKNLSPEVIKTYWQLLKCFTWVEVRYAFKAHIINPDGGQFMPKPADIIRQLKGSGASRAANAWAKVNKAIEHIGSYTSVVFDDALIHAVIDNMGGWVRLCQTSTEHLKFRQIEFERCYQDFLIYLPSVYPKVLRGRVEALNARDDYSIPPPTFVGDKCRAQQVMCTGEGDTLAIHEPSHRQNNVMPMRQVPTRRNLL